jgi:hypothetical protein
MLAVVVSDVEVDGEYRFERRMFGDFSTLSFRAFGPRNLMKIGQESGK